MNCCAQVVVALRKQSEEHLNEAAKPLRELLEKLQPPVGRQPKAGGCRWNPCPIDTQVTKVQVHHQQWTLIALQGKLKPCMDSFKAIKDRIPEVVSNPCCMPCSDLAPGVVGSIGS